MTLIHGSGVGVGAGGVGAGGVGGERGGGGGAVNPWGAVLGSPRRICGEEEGAKVVVGRGAGGVGGGGRGLFPRRICGVVEVANVVVGDGSVAFPLVFDFNFDFEFVLALYSCLKCLDLAIWAFPYSAPFLTAVGVISICSGLLPLPSSAVELSRSQELSLRPSLRITNSNFCSLAISCSVNGPLTSPTNCEERVKYVRNSPLHSS